MASKSIARQAGRAARAFETFCPSAPLPAHRNHSAVWDKAAGWGVRGRHDHALDRSIAGQVRLVFCKGRRCGEHVRFHHGLTIAVLNMAARNVPAPASIEEDRRVLKDFLGPDR